MELKRINCAHWQIKLILLIVPYGIETSYYGHRFYSLALLIVPYGIETNLLSPTRISTLTFNCTLWN